MLHTPLPSLITGMALPAVASQLITVLYHTADTYFVSQINTSASAAVGVVFSLMSIIQAFGYGLGMGANSLISRSLGAARNEEACRFANSALFAAACIGTLLMAGGLLELEALMRMLGSTQTMLPHACGYGRYILIGAPVMCSAFVLTDILRAEGKTLFAMWGLCAGGFINIALDPLLIFTFGMGAAGAALATLVSQIVSFLILLCVFLRRKCVVRLGVRWVSRRMEDYWLICKCGFPTICRQGLASLASALLNVNARAYGDAAVAAITIANKIYLLIRNIVLGIGQAFQPIAGYNYGAGAHKRVKKAFLFSCALGTGLCVVAAAVIAVYADLIVGWFRADPAVVGIGTTALHYACAVMPLMAYSTFVNQLYQCLGFSARATFLACCRQGVFFIPLVLVLPRFFGLSGIQALQPAADLLTFLISVPFQLRFFQRALHA